MSIRSILDDKQRFDLMQLGRRAFARGENFEAHELWEDAWNGTEGPARLWIQALILIATALYKLERGRPDICSRLLVKALGKLGDAPGSFDGIALGETRETVQRLIGALDRKEGIDSELIRLRSIVSGA